MRVNYDHCLKLCIGPVFETSLLQDKSCNVFTVFIIIHMLKDIIVKLDLRDTCLYKCKRSAKFPTCGAPL